MMVPSSRRGTPFPFEGPIPPELLIDRESELQRLGRRAGDRVNVRLVAPRRFGKTSVLLAHARLLQAVGWRTAHVDFSRVADLTDVARRVAVAYGALDGGWVRAHLAGLISRLGLTLSAAGPAIGLGPRPPVTEVDVADSVLHELLDLPRTLFNRDQTPTLVVFDEFQDLLVARKGLDGVLRSRIQYHGDAAAYVYAGSEPSMMRELFEARERPLFGQADPLILGPLPLEATQRDLLSRFDDEGLAPGETLAQLTAFAAGHPQRAMLLAYLLAERLSEGQEPSTALSAAVIEDALERASPSYVVLWQQLGRVERALLAAVADGRAPTSRTLAAELQIPRNTLNAAADRLADQGHLVRRPRASHLVDPLLAEWLRRR